MEKLELAKKLKALNHIWRKEDDGDGLSLFTLAYLTEEPLEAVWDAGQEQGFWTWCSGIKLPVLHPKEDGEGYYTRVLHDITTTLSRESQRLNVDGSGYLSLLEHYQSFPDPMRTFNNGCPAAVPEDTWDLLLVEAGREK